jgi:integrative and conjugative element protein (TIGR02256 family)
VLDPPPDRVVMDHKKTYEVRIDETAMETIREWVRASVNGRTHGAGHTGGLLLGQFDSASRVAWVSQATGPPQDNSVNPLKMNLDADDVRDFLQARRRQSGGMLTLIGFWHTHLGGSAAPSETDLATMREIVASPEWRSAPALLLVLGVPEDGSVGDPASPWLPEIHVETVTAG